MINILQGRLLTHSAGEAINGTHILRGVVICTHSAGEAITAGILQGRRLMQSNLQGRQLMAHVSASGN